MNRIRVITDMQMHAALVMYYGAVQCFIFRGLVLNKLEATLPKTTGPGRH